MHRKQFLTGAICVAAGVLIGLVMKTGIAAQPAPTEHAGLSVEKFGVVSEQSIEATTGLKDYFMQLRLISIEPGGQIARHGHEKRPGLVKVLKGEWTEGRPEGEVVYSETDEGGLVEDENTVHWFFNRGEDVATAVVCDLTPTN